MIGLCYFALILGVLNSLLFGAREFYLVASGVNVAFHLFFGIVQAGFFVYFTYHLFYGFPKWIRELRKS